MAQRRQKLRDRYKLGFDRLAVVLFCLFAAAFALLALLVNEPYGLPEEGTPARVQIDAEVAAECAPDQIEALAAFCEERVLASYRWAHYGDMLDVDRLGWLYTLLLIAMVLLIAVPAARWVRAGFRTPQSSRDPFSGNTADS